MPASWLRPLLVRRLMVVPAVIRLIVGARSAVLVADERLAVGQQGAVDVVLSVLEVFEYAAASCDDCDARSAL